MEEKRIIEIGGVKVEVDLREAKQIDTYRIGDPIKILVKKYGDEYTSYPAVIVGFDNFPDLPTIIIAYLEVSYSTAEVKFVYLNANTGKNYQICPAVRKEDFIIDKVHAVELLDKSIQQKAAELEDLKSKRKYFIANFEKFVGATRI